MPTTTPQTSGPLTVPRPGLQVRLTIPGLTALVLLMLLIVPGCDDRRAGRAAPDSAATALLDTFETISSRGGVLGATLTAATSQITLGGQTFPSMVYNGAYLPPVLRLGPGDSLKLHLVNQLSKDEFTNLHYHGTQVSPKAPSDNIFLHVNPGTTYDYRVYFPPNHDRGLFWYHPHPHGESEDQVLGGMSGVLVVEGFLQSFYPWLRDVPERIVMLKAYKPPGYKDGQPHTKTLNGRTDGTIPIRSGELQFWRIANIAADAYFNLRIDGARMWLLASDADPLRRPQRVDSILLPPGARAELILEGPAAGRYAIRHLAYDTGPQGDPNPAATLGTLVSAGPPVDRRADAARLDNLGGDIAAVAQDIDSLRTHAITRRRTFVFSESANGDTFFVNRKQFAPNRVDTQVRVGDVEEWTVENTSGEVHAFHIHQTDFLVTGINGVPQPANGLHDTVNLPYAVNGRPGVVKIVVPFTDPNIVGKFVYHCHILEHEDGGMMATLQVNPSAAARTAPPRQR
jgi:suppressor of ftsI